MAVHLTHWYIVFVCHQNDVCKDAIDSVYVGGYCGLSESELGVFSKLCPVGFLIVCECSSVLLQSVVMSAFKPRLHTFIHPVLVTFPHHMSILSQPTTSNDSCDRLNFNQLSQLFTFPSVFNGNTTHPSNHLHLCSFKL